MRTLFAAGLLFLSGITQALNIPAPELALPTFEGDRTVNLKALQGKVVVISFWASWCSSCEAAFPALNTLHGTFKGKGVEIISVNVDMQKVDAEFFLQKSAAQFTVLYDAERKSPEKFAMQSMPSSYLIDKKGHIRQVFREYRPGDDKKMADAIDRLLKE